MYLMYKSKTIFFFKYPYVQSTKINYRIKLKPLGRNSYLIYNINLGMSSCIIIQGTQQIVNEFYNYIFYRNWTSDKIFLLFSSLCPSRSDRLPSICACLLRALRPSEKKNNNSNRTLVL